MTTELTTKTEEKFTTKQMAEQLGTSPKVVLENAKKCLPNKVIENGKATYWTKAEVTMILEQMKESQPNQSTFTGAVKAVTTDLTPALMIKKAMELAQQGYELELRRIEAEKQAVLKRAEKAEIAYKEELDEHIKDKELVNHKYLTATQIKDEIFKKTGKKVIVSKAVRNIPIEENEILYKPFQNGNYTGQQPVYHPNILDKLLEIL